MAQGRKLYTTFMESTTCWYSAGSATPCCAHWGLSTTAAGPTHTSSRTCSTRATCVHVRVYVRHKARVRKKDERNSQQIFLLDLANPLGQKVARVDRAAWTAGGELQLEDCKTT
ncbi:hypothetical protein Vafri_12959 [Volvox africanus]|nr:hypothetical protein Vafri_12959 [Volvox africanus]